ncbi:MAG: YtxH domain-containing protein [Acidobacteriota bacterium]|jgi:gas vesicle protein
MADKNGNSGDKLVYFLIGAGIGAITALLFAPKSGEELRSDIADATRKGIDYARETGRDISERAGDYYQDRVEQIADLSARSKDAVSEITDRGRDLLTRQKSQLSAALEAGKQGYREAKRADSAAAEEV